MKKTITFSIAALAALSASAQLPVSTVAGKKQVLVEELTGNKCGFCPAGHQIADNIVSQNPGKAFALTIHPDLGTNSLTYPSTAANGKDLRSTAATNFVMTPGVIAASGGGNVGLPAGVVNRMLPISPAVSQYNAGGLIMDRNYWAGMASTILTQNSYVNVAGSAYLNPTTRQMYVYMEAYYTANSTVSANRISVALAQNNILGYQSSGSTYPAMWNGSDYKHNHALREYINTGSPNGSRGEIMTGPNTAGTKWTKTFLFTVPADYGTVSGKKVPAILADLEIIAYVSETEKNILAVCKVPITITTAAGIFVADAQASELISFVNTYPNPMTNEGNLIFTLNQSAPVTVKVINTLGQIVISDDLKTLDSGEHKYTIDAARLTNGVYFINIEVDGNVITKKISVLK